MIAVREILFPTNFLREARIVAPTVSRIASSLGANVTVLHVVRPELLDDATKAHFQAEMVELLPPTATVGHVRYRVISGESAGRGIADYAAVHESDLILMPSRRHGLLRRLFRRSTTEDVLRNTETAVWTQPPWGAGFNPRGASAPPPVVCLLRLNDEDAVTLSYAHDLATRLDSRLVVCHALPEVNEGTLARMVDCKQILDPAEARRRIDDLLATSGLTAEVHIGAGAPTRVLRQIAKPHVVVAARGEDPSAFDLARSLPCPVLIRPTTRLLASRIFHAVDHEVASHTAQ